MLIGIAVLSNFINSGESLSKHGKSKQVPRTHLFRKARRRSVLNNYSTYSTSILFVSFPLQDRHVIPYEARQTTFYSYIILRRFRLSNLLFRLYISSLQRTSPPSPSAHFACISFRASWSSEVVLFELTAYLT